MISERRAGMLLALLAASGYSFLPIFTRRIYEVSELQPLDAVTWRFMFAVPAIWLGIMLRDALMKQKPQRDTTLPRKKLLAMGTLYAGTALTAFFGLELIPASLFIVLFYTYPAMVSLLSLFLGQKLSALGWFALGLTLVGIILTVPDLSVGDTNVIGIGLALFNALLVAIYFLIIGYVMKGTKSVARGSAYVITGTMLTLFLALPFNGLAIPANLETWLLLIGLSTISTAMPILVINIAIQKIGAARASIINTVEPVETMLLALLLLGEVILPVQWLGAALIIAAVLLLELRPQAE